MRSVRRLIALLTVALFAAGTVFAATEKKAVYYPDELRQKIRKLKEAAHVKKDMPESLPEIEALEGDRVMKMLRTKKAVVLDNRVKTQYDSEKIQNAEWFSADDLYDNPAAADKLDKNKEYILYCQGTTCWRSPATALMLQFLGFKKIYWYRGGIRDWKDRGYPTE